MLLTLTSGLFPVAGLPIPHLLELRVFITNLENTPGEATVEVYKLVGSSKKSIFSQKVAVPGDDRRVVKLTHELVEGQTLEVCATLSGDGLMRESGLRPGIAVVSHFTDDGSTALLQWISADDFVPVSANLTID